jgi:hypothetical protein
MQLVPVYLSVFALVVAVGSFVVSILNYRRDSGKVLAWSTILHERSGSTPESTTLVMRIRILNKGRRPVSILNLVMVADDVRWFTSFKRPDFGKKEISAEEYFQEIYQRSAAHLLAIRLNEGEAFEVTYRPEDEYEFLHVREDDALLAKELLVEDLSGKIYPVRDSAKHLAQIFEVKTRGALHCSDESREPLHNGPTAGSGGGP